MKTETIFSTVCFTLINVLFLLNHFSPWGCLAVGLTVLFYFLKVNLIGRKHTDKTISDYLGTYIGAMLLDMVAILGLEENIINKAPASFASLPAYAIVVPILILGAGIGIMAGFNSVRGTYNCAQFYIKNIILLGLFVGVPYFFVDWDFMSVFTFGAVIVFAGAFIDLMPHSDRDYRGGFFTSCALMLIFNILCALYPDLAVRIVDIFTNYAALNAAPWYNYLIPSILLAACAVYSFISARKEEDSAKNIRTYLLLISVAAYMWISGKVSTKYDFIFLLIFTAVNFAFIVVPHKERNIIIFGAKISSVNLKYSVFLIIALLFPVAFFYGRLLIHICITVLTVCVVAVYAAHVEKQYRSLDFSADDPVKTFAFWQLILSAAAVLALICVYLKCNFAANYVLVCLIYALATVCLIALNCKNKLRPKNHYIMRIIVAVFAIMCMLFTVNQAKIKFTYKVDNKISEEYGVDAEKVGETKEITFGAKSKKTKVEGYWYWADNKDDVSPLSADKKVKNTASMKNGLLYIIAEDKNGVTAVSSRWFFDNELVMKKNVGRIRYGHTYSPLTGTLAPEPTEAADQSAE